MRGRTSRSRVSKGFFSVYDLSVAVNFLFQLIFIFPFLGVMVMYANEF